MQTIKINQYKISQEEIRIIAEQLKGGKTIVYPTDTIYGLGCLATDNNAIRKIFRIKNKDRKKPLLVLVGSMAMAKKYSFINKSQERFLKTVWPGPVSVIVGSRGILPKELSGSDIGMRLPKNDFLIKMIKAVKVPLVSTSANISGKEPIYDPKDLGKYFKAYKPDLLIDGGVLKGKASTIVDLREANNIKILRK